MCSSSAPNIKCDVCVYGTSKTNKQTNEQIKFLVTAVGGWIKSFAFNRDHPWFNLLCTYTPQCVVTLPYACVKKQHMA